MRLLLSVLLVLLLPGLAARLRAEARHRLLELLEPGELPGLRALVPVARRSVDGGPLVATPLPRGPFKTASPAAATTASDGSTTRTPRPLVSMLARELATLTGCRPGATQMAVLGELSTDGPGLRRVPA